MPPRTSHGFAGLIATLMNCSVLLSLLSMWLSSVGTRESSRLQVGQLPDVLGSGLPPLRNGLSHWDEMSENVPFVRITPPSEPSKIWVGLPGLIDDRVLVGMDAVRSARQARTGRRSGAYAHHVAGVSCASYVRSVNVRLPFAQPSGSPAVVE